MHGQGGADPVLDTLLLALDQLPPQRPGSGDKQATGTLLLGARFGRALCHRPLGGWHFVQPFRPDAAALEQAGQAVLEVPESARFARVLVLPARQREQARAMLAQAALHVADGGVVLAATANNAGAGTLVADMTRLFGEVSSLSKHKCRAVWAGTDRRDLALLDEWRALDAPRRNAAGYLSRPGLFAWDRIDPASALLADTLPTTLEGTVADLGAGYGFLSAQVLLRCPAVQGVLLLEADARALAPAEANLTEANARRRRPAAVSIHWHDVASGVQGFGPVDAVVTNPPFHIGRADRPALGRAFIDAAADLLQREGTLWLVANRHLPYESRLAERFSAVASVAEGAGFKVLRATLPRPRGPRP